MNPVVRSVGDFEQFACIKKLSEGQRNIWKKFAQCEPVKKLDEPAIISTKAYTFHNFSNHCYNIFKIISEVLIKSDTWEKFNGDLLLLLDIAILFHDCSMPYVGAGATKRENHAEESANIFIEFCNKNDEYKRSIGENNIPRIAEIIKAHSGSYERIGEIKCPDIKMLAGFLRLADELDITKERIPDGYFETMKELQEKKSKEEKEDEEFIESFKHWKKLKCFEEIAFDEKTLTAKLKVDKDFFLCNYKDDKSELILNITEVTKKVCQSFNDIRHCSESTGFSSFISFNQIKVDFSNINSDTKEGDGCRKRFFYKNVLPFLLNYYLPNHQKELFDKLATDENSPYHEKKLPLIRMGTGRNVVTLKKSNEDARPTEPDNRSSEFLAWKKQSLGVKLENLPMYIMDKFDAETNVIEVAHSTYFESHGTSDIYFSNLIRFFPDEFFYDTNYQRLNDVIELHEYPRFSDEVEQWISLLRKVVIDNSFKSHFAGLGVSVLTVLKRDSRYHYPISKNDPLKAAGGHDRIVIPAGGYQPTGLWDHSDSLSEIDDMDPRLQVLREFMEELLDEDELRRHPSEKLYQVINEKKQKAEGFINDIDVILNSTTDIIASEEFADIVNNKMLIQEIFKALKHQRGKSDNPTSFLYLLMRVKEENSEDNQKELESLQLVDSILKNNVEAITDKKELESLISDEFLLDKILNTLNRSLEKIGTTYNLSSLLEIIKAKSLIMKRIIDDILEKNEESVKLIQTGIAFDILRMRPEIIYLMILKDDVYSNKKGYLGSWESEKIDWIELCDNDNYKDLIKNEEIPLVAPGYAALIWGRNRAVEILNLEKALTQC